jgi:magnesium-protoporphyrin O-methyltransferase
MFDAKQARKDLKAYRRKGPRGATRRLLAALRERLDSGFSLLDIGGGVGVLQHELARAGALSVTAVDASHAYLDQLDVEAQRQGYRERQTLVEGDFVAVADRIQPATVVTLDKVICCYPDMQLLVAASAAKAKRIYAIVIPSDRLWLRALSRVANFVVSRILGWQFRSFVHSHQAIDAVCASQGLLPSAADPGWVWHIRVYERPNASLPG